MENRLWSKVGFENNARFMTNSAGEAVASGGLNATTRDMTRMMDVLINDGKNKKVSRYYPKSLSKAIYNFKKYKNNENNQFFYYPIRICNSYFV